MKKRLFLWQLAGFFTAALGGTLLHFLFGWTNKSPLVALISGVNESTWEHMKLLFFPMLFFAIIQYGFFSEEKNFWWVKLCGIVSGIIMIPVLFYTYNGAFGKSPDWLNIIFFFIAAATAYLIEAHLFSRNNLNFSSSTVPLFFVLLIASLFFIFTFYPPELPLFRDPATGTYGI